MKLWLLKMKAERHYDTNQGMVVSGHDEEHARGVAAEEANRNGGGEVRLDHANEDRAKRNNVVYNPWTDPEATTCEELVPSDSLPGHVYLVDYNEP